MSTLAKELKVKISADANGLKGALNNISKEISKVSKDFEGLKKVGEGISSVGKKLTVGLSLPIAGIGAVSGKTAMDFEAGMNKVSAISGATGKDLEKLENLAKEMGRTTKFTSLESAEALSYMGMAGWKTQDMLNGLPGILSLASAGGTDLALTSDIVTDGLTAMGLTAKDTDKFVDIMASTVSNANTSIELMGETLAYVGPVAGSLGIEMDDLSVAIGLMGNAGLKGSQAGTSLRAGLTNLVKPTKEMKNAMEKYGVELVKNADGSVDLMGTMQNLRNVLGELDQTTQAQALATIFGKEAMSGWASIVNASESDFNKLTEAIANSEGSAKSMADTMMGGAKGALTEMKSALEGVAITIGERLTPFIEKLADGVSKLCTWFQSLSPATQTFLMVVAGLIALLGPLLLLIGSTVSLFANLSIVAGALGVSVGALVGAFASVVGIVAGVVGAIAGFIAIVVNAYKTNETFRKNVDTVFNNIKSIISNVMSAIGSIISTTMSLISVIWNNGLKQILNLVLNILSSILSTFTSKLNSISNIVKTSISLITSIFRGDFKSVENIVNNVLNNVVNKFNSGMEKAKSAISKGINAMKNMFNITFPTPKIKLPRISISGSFSLNPPSVPKFGISWYSKGAIFKRPTVLGGMGVGDAHNGIGSGAEAILPIKELPKLLGLDKMQNGGVNLSIENFNNNTDKDIEYLANELAFYLSRKKIGMGGAF